MDESAVKEHLKVFSRFNPIMKVWKSSYADSVRHHATPLEKTNWFFHQNSSFIYQQLPQEALEIIKKHLEKAPDGLKLELLALGGQVSRIHPRQTAFPWCESFHWLHLQGAWRDPYEANLLIDINEKLFIALQPYLINPQTGTIRAYVNFHSFNVGDKYPQAYWGDNYPRLQHIKRKYDPDNFFTTPQPIIPK